MSYTPHSHLRGVMMILRCVVISQDRTTPRDNHLGLTEEEEMELAFFSDVEAIDASHDDDEEMENCVCR